ncbi:DUF3560 domain-containing protein, partial [Streptomyces decoyicus]
MKLWTAGNTVPQCAHCVSARLGVSTGQLPGFSHVPQAPDTTDESAAGKDSQEVTEEAADIIICHTPADGTQVHGTEKGDEAGKILLRKEYGRRGGMPFKFSRALGYWVLYHSRDRDADMWTVNKLRGYLQEAGYTVAVEIDNDAERSFAQAEEERYEKADDRTSRFSGYAGNAAARSEAQWKRSDAISERFHMGQPIIFDHHSTRGALKDRERMHSAMRSSIAEQGKAAHWSARAISSEHYQEYRTNPGRTLRRLEKLRKELRDIAKWQRGESACGYTRALTPEGIATLDREHRRAAEQVAYWEAVITKAEADGFKVWGPDDFAKGDFVNSMGHWFEVTRINKKTLTIPHIHLGVGNPVVRKSDMRGAKDTYTVSYDEVSGHATAGEIAEWMSAEPGELSKCPHCVHVAGGELRYSVARHSCTKCGYAKPRKFTPPTPQPEPETEKETTPEPEAMPTVTEEQQPAATEADTDTQAQEGSGAACPMCRSAQWDADALRCAHCHHNPTGAPAPAPAETDGPRWLDGPALVFIASKETAPALKRGLYRTTRAEAMALCRDERTHGTAWGLHWSERPGVQGEDFDFVADDGRFTAVLAELGITPARDWPTETAAAFPASCPQCFDRDHFDGITCTACPTFAEPQPEAAAAEPDQAEEDEDDDGGPLCEACGRQLQPDRAVAEMSAKCSAQHWLYCTRRPADTPAPAPAPEVEHKTRTYGGSDFDGAYGYTGVCSCNGWSVWDVDRDSVRRLAKRHRENPGGTPSPNNAPRSLSIGPAVPVNAEPARDEFQAHSVIPGVDAYA